jgi:hypothetical protein
MADKGKFSKEDEDRYKRILKLMKDSEKSLSNQNKFADGISNAIFGIGSSDWFDKLNVSSEDLSKMKEDFIALNKIISDNAKVMNDEFKKAIEENRGDILGIAQDLSKVNEELSMGLVEAVQKRDFTGFLNKFGDEGERIFKEITKDKNFTKLDEFFKGKSLKDFKGVTAEAKKLEQALEGANKQTLSFSKALNKIGQNLLQAFKPEAVKNALLDFDQTITETQRNTGIAMKENTIAFTELTMQTARFGMSVKDTSELMTKLGQGLRTTDFEILSGAAQDMGAISKATGVSIEEVGELGSQMMLFGKTSEDVSKFAESTMKSAHNFGVNGKKIMSDIVKNIPKFRQMGFQGGEDSLKRMAIQAERLGQNIDEIFDVAKRARTIEGALDMAAELQLAGGSFANINPMDLLAAARKGPEELQKILSQMGADIGNFNEATGEMAFDAVDFDRMQMVANATGMSVDSLQKQITKTAQDNQKLKFLPPGMFDGLSPEEQAFIANSMKMKDGKLVDFGIEGVDDISKLTKEQITAAMKKAGEDKKTLEEQAEQNMSFQESVASLKTAVMNIFTFLEPVVKMLTSGVQLLNEGLAKLPGWSKALIAGIVGAGVLLFGFAKQFASGFAFGKGQNAALQGGGFFKSMLGMFGKGKGVAGAAGGALGGVLPTAKQAEAIPAGTGLKNFLTNLGTGLSNFGQNFAKVVKGALAFGIALTLIGAPLLMSLAFVGKEKALVAFGFAMVEMATALWITSKITGNISLGNVLKGALAMGLMGGAIMLFGFGMQQYAGLDWGQLAIIGAAVLGAALLLFGISFLAVPIAIGALVLAGAGLSLMIFGFALQTIAGSFAEMNKIDWKTFSLMGPALLSAVPGLLALGGIGLFALPGLFLMTGVLAGLAMVMVVLAPALSMASQSMIKMAEGIDKLKEAVKGLDTSKLRELSDTAEKLATASAIGALAGAVNAITGGGGGATKSQTMKLEPITINLKMNGRLIQQEIVDSTAHIT